MLGLPLEHVARVLFWLAVIVFLTAGVVYLIRRMRDTGDEATESSGELLTKFRDIHAQGSLSDEEYQTIKGRLAAKMQSELKHEDEAG
jgi:uncharacterized membrane protein